MLNVEWADAAIQPYSIPDKAFLRKVFVYRHILASYSTFRINHYLSCMNTKTLFLQLCAALWVCTVYAQRLPPARTLTDTLYLTAGIEASGQDPRLKEWQAEQVTALKNSGILISALGQKAKVPDFTLKNTKGKTVNLYTELQRGPVIVLWYQGGWNIYCTLTLRYMEAYRDTFKKYGATVLALTPELPEKALATQTKHKLTFDVLPDKNNTTAKQFGIVYTLNDSLNRTYETLYALSKINGNTSGELPLPATYLIQPNGKAGYVFLDADVRRRAEPRDLLRALTGWGFPPRP